MTEATRPRIKTKQINTPTFDVTTALFGVLGVDLTEIHGLGPSLALMLVGECGTGLRAWPSAKHFTPWLCLAPGNKISGGKVLSSRTLRSSSRAAALLCGAEARTPKCSALGRRVAAIRSAHRLAELPDRSKWPEDVAISFFEPVFAFPGLPALLSDCRIHSSRTSGGDCSWSCRRTASHIPALHTAWCAASPSPLTASRLKA